MPEKKNGQIQSSPALPYEVRKPTVPEAQIRKSWQAISKRINENAPEDREAEKGRSYNK